MIKFCNSTLLFLSLFRYLPLVCTVFCLLITLNGKASVQVFSAIISNGKASVQAQSAIILNGKVSVQVCSAITEMVKHQRKYVVQLF